MDGSYTRVHFRVKADTMLGQTIGVIGSCQSLGAYNQSRIIRLVTSPESYPVWFSLKPIVVPRGSKISYKYCLLEADEFVSYESRPITFNSRDSFDGDLNGSRYLVPSTDDIELEDEIQLLTTSKSLLGDSEHNLLHKINEMSSENSNKYVDNYLPTTTSNRLIIPCYHLPVKIQRITNDEELRLNNNSPFKIFWAESLIAKSSNSVSESISTFWIGTVSLPEGTKAEEVVILQNMLSTMNCIPVFIDANIAKDAYHGYCKQVMWPIFHNVDQLDHIHAAWNMNSPSQPIKKVNLAGNVTISTETDVHMQQLDWISNHEHYYHAYQTVNSTFADVLAKMILPNDIVWVHDYHLMLLPKLLRDQNHRDINIVYFLHIPFPTSQIFRALSNATELLHSMTCADVVGFHAFDHARHFLNATKRVLGIRSHTRGGMLSLKVKDREVIVTMSHVSVEPETIDAAVSDPITQQLVENYRRKYAGKKIVVGVDVCQRLSGGILKLAAYEKLLVDNSNINGSVVLIQRMLRPKARIADEESTSNDMMKMVAGLNSRFSFDSHVAIDYEESQSLSLNERVALWLVADVFLLTPIREGLNLMPLEYIYARKDLPHAGVVVASEFSTVCSLLNGSLKVNPYYALNVADALDKALSMTSKECEQRRQRDIGFVSSHPSSKWTKDIISDLQFLKNVDSKKKNSVQSIMPDPLNIGVVKSVYDDCGRGAVVSKCCRVFVLDYGGTLLHKEKFDIYIKQTLSAISGRKPTSGMMDALRKLSNDPRNAVLVVTGLTKLKLGDTFNDFENITLATSNGLVYSWGKNLLTSEETDKRLSHVAGVGKFLNTSDSFESRLETALTQALNARKRSNSTGQLLAFNNDDVSVNDGDKHDDKMLIRRSGYYSSTGRLWECVDFRIDWAAVRDISIPIISKFTYRTNGTCLSPRIPGIGWSYFGADPEWGEKQASQLRVELEGALAGHDVKVTSQIQGSIEVVPRALHKGVITKSFFKRVMEQRAGKLPSFVTIIGDEVSDDKMFDEAYELIASSPNGSGSKETRLFTICVGKRETPADLYVNDVHDVEMFLSTLGDSTSTVQPVDKMDVVVDTVTLSD